ncbi:uncharacterized protein PHACADRAFT_256112 [Phanerochaete carnosa HHB-10118-sp]|uniref:Uncharacterized protein n=1 Tax=Phanerochaete carnosa (strain HHB-10118-sp) TaxID=650164 RepID=K5WY92_PHACS|nr:uncharacterized protein PHACADRAFT_256112 [Phanerochaete carnosa HHB-10118-sp]EKM55467.1 hypothetical protein PHACADRAFT_256112 [Phanerochaete carnosa HHB-10118-sp]
MNLNQTLEPLGVRVCSLTTGAPEDFGEFPSTPSRAHDGTTVTNATKTRPSAEKITPGMTNTDGALPETPYFSAVCDVLESITSAA